MLNWEFSVLEFNVELNQGSEIRSSPQLFINSHASGIRYRLYWRMISAKAINY